jgi:hypothetical protein
MLAIESSWTLQAPLLSASWCRKMMLRTIQPIDSRPVKPPSIAALPAISTGIP